MSTREALLQYLQSFTVQIRHRKNERQIVGTGFVVSRNGIVATCKHVVTAADVRPVPSTSEDSQSLGVYFPEMPNRRSLLTRAKVKAALSSYADDVVLLQLMNQVDEIYLWKVAVLGRAEQSFLKPFVSYGFARLDQYVGHSARGEIHICVERPAGYLAAPFELQSSRISRGMSGAAVLDLTRNLVVGIVSEIFDARGAPQNRDAGFAVNARILSQMGVELEISESDYDLEAAPRPQADMKKAKKAASERSDFAFNGAPEEQRDWVGRDEQLLGLQQDWKNPNRRITALIAFGGEGKSSLVRRWLDSFVRPATDLRADGVFWWTFTETQTVERFFSEALKYIASSNFDVNSFTSSNSRLHFLAAMLTDKHYIFVLDQLERVQHLAGDKRGFVVDPQLREFLELFGAPSHKSFCVLTSRLPVADLARYLKTYVERDLERLTSEEGRSLLIKIGIQGTKEELTRIVEAWDGHALSIGVIGGYLLSSHEGKAEKVEMIRAPTAVGSAQERIQGLLGWYDDQLDAAERLLLTVAAAYRGPVTRSELLSVATAEPASSSATSSGGLDYGASENFLEALVRRRLLRHDPESDRYFLHALVRRHYMDLLAKSDPNEVRALHRRIKSQYLTRSPDVPANPTLTDLAPLIEAVYHAAQAGDFEDAFQIYWNRISQEDKGVLIHRMGAIETDLGMVRQFFPEEDLRREPQVAHDDHKTWLINQAGLCMAGLGRLQQSSELLRRTIHLAVARGLWIEAGTSSGNLAAIEMFLGRLTTARRRARASYRYGNRVSDAKLQMQSSGILGRIEYLRGQLDSALALFEEAQKLELDQKPAGVSCLSGFNGIFYSELLQRIGRTDEALRVAHANLSYSKDGRRPLESLAHCRIAEIGVGLSDAKRQFHFDEAVRLARLIGRREVLLQVLVARGRYAVQVKHAERAMSDLQEALELTVRGGYKIVEIDARLALATLYGQRNQTEDASREQATATRLALEAGYHWGTMR